LRLPLAKGHYLLGEILRASNDAGARKEYAQALRLIDEINTEEGGQHVLKRSDLGPMRAEAERWSKGA